MTKYQRLSGSSNRNLFSNSSEDWKTKIKVLADLVSGESYLPGMVTMFSIMYTQGIEYWEGGKGLMGGGERGRGRGTGRGREIERSYGLYL